MEPAGSQETTYKPQARIWERREHLGEHREHREQGRTGKCRERDGRGFCVCFWRLGFCGVLDEAGAGRGVGWGGVAMEEEKIEQAVLAYLKKKGYRQAELAFQDEQQTHRSLNSSSGGGADGGGGTTTPSMDPAVANSIFLYAR